MTKWKRKYAPRIRDGKRKREKKVVEHESRADIVKAA